MNIIFSLLSVLNYVIYFSFAYYGNPKNGGTTITPVITNALLSIGDEIYSLGGKVLDEDGGLYPFIITERVFIFG